MLTNWPRTSIRAKNNKGTNSGIIIIAFKKIVLLAPSVSALTKFAMKTIPNEPMNKFINICSL